MERKVTLLVLAFAVISCISIMGFYASYLSYFPDFNKFPLDVHLHFTGFTLWFALLIIQPVLIKKENYTLHRRIGKAGYILIPILVISILVMVFRQAQVLLPKNEEIGLLTAFVGVLDAISLLAYYSIAMFNKKHVRWHIAFIIACSLVILNPGLSRLLNPIKPGLGMLVAIILPIVVSTSILMYEKIKLKYPILSSPYLLFLCCWIAEILLLFTIPKTSLWQDFVLRVLN